MRHLGVLYVLLMAACGGAGGGQAATLTTDYDGDTALGYVKAQLEFGPRIPGSPGHKRAGEWIAQMMRERADTVLEQRWQIAP